MAHMFGFFFIRARRDRKSKGQGTIKLGGHMKKEVYMVGDPRDFATTTPLITTFCESFKDFFFFGAQMERIHYKKKQKQ
jgi:hypothetical protein